MEYFENVVPLPEIQTQCSFLSKHEFKLNFNILIHRGGRVLDTLCQHPRDIQCVSVHNHCELDFGS